MIWIHNVKLNIGTLTIRLETIFYLSYLTLLIFYFKWGLPILEIPPESDFTPELDHPIVVRSYL